MSYDVFISYARSDDDTPSGASAGWVTTFVDELKKVMRHLLGGQGASFFMDHQLTANDRVNDVLMETVRASQTMVLFLSKGFLKSTWCQREIGRFLELNAATKNRESVFVVELDETPRTEWPRRLQELTPLRFYEESRDGTPLLMGYPTPPRDGASLYWQRLSSLAHMIRKHLLAKPSRAMGFPVVVAGTPTTAGIKPVVWIAEPSIDRQMEWEWLASAVRQRGADVVPAACMVYPRGAHQEFRAAVESDLARSQLLVQYHSADPETPFPGTSIGPVGLQSMLSRIHAETHPHVRLIQRLAGRSLRPGERNELPPVQPAWVQGVIQAGIEELRQEVLAALDALLAPRPSPVPPVPAATGSLLLCISAGPSDGEFSEQVAGMVRDLGHEPLPIPASPAAGQTPQQYREEFEAVVRESNGILLVHATQPLMWVMSKYAQIRKILADAGRSRAGAVLEGPPSGAPRLPREPRGLRRLDCASGLTQEAFLEFFQGLHEEPARV